MQHDPDALVRLPQDQYKKLLADLNRYKEALEHIGEDYAYDCCSKAIAERELHGHYQDMAKAALGIE